MSSTIDPFDPAVLADPFPHLDAMREHGDGIQVFEQMGAYALLRYDDVESAYKDPTRFSSQLFWASPAAQHDEDDPDQVRFVESASRNILFQDPPEHTRLRGLVRHAFTPRAVTSMRGRVESMVEELVAVLPVGVEFDFMDAFAEALPVMAVAEMLGVPIPDRHRFRRWSGAAASTLEPGLPADARAAAVAQVAELSTYLEGLVDERRGSPGDDLLSALILAEEEGERLSGDELGAMVVMLLVAGNETTTNLLGNGLALLLDHPDQRAWLAARPEAVPAAIEEMLRFSPPLLFNGRVTAAAVKAGERMIPEASLVMLGIAAANRDPRRFSNAGSFDVSRPAPKHLSFGHGIHFCVGSALARLEASIAFPALLEVDRLRAGEGEREVKLDLLSRGYRRLPVVLG